MFIAEKLENTQKDLQFHYAERQDPPKIFRAYSVHPPKFCKWGIAFLSKLLVTFWACQDATVGFSC